MSYLIQWFLWFLVYNLAKIITIRLADIKNGIEMNNVQAHIRHDKSYQESNSLPYVLQLIPGFSSVLKKEMQIVLNPKSYNQKMTWHEFQLHLLKHHTPNALTLLTQPWHIPHYWMNSTLFAITDWTTKKVIIE